MAMALAPFQESSLKANHEEMCQHHNSGTIIPSSKVSSKKVLFWVSENVK